MAGVLLLWPKDAISSEVSHSGLGILIRDFADDIFKLISFNEYKWFVIEIYLNSFPKFQLIIIQQWFR